MRKLEADSRLVLSDDEFWAFAEFADDCWHSVVQDVRTQLGKPAYDRTRPDVVVVRHLLNWHSVEHDFEDEIVADLTKHLLDVSWSALVELAERADQAITENANALFADVDGCLELECGMTPDTSHEGRNHDQGRVP